jgi:adenosylcobyric acid synthase
MGRTPAIMLQGTGSHAGKSVLAAGLCRLFARHGLRALPFKSQNMSNNAHVTRAGEEMGWAQAMQAEAAGVASRVEMNPVLLKPEGEDRSQVIRLGRVLTTVRAREYRLLAPTLWPAIAESYARLAAEADVMVLEGAGSPAEPNLARYDLANMRVARLAAASVLIVGDIDRGGVFASLTGTMLLLPPRDRRMVSGFIINKFRGDSSLLTPALGDLRRRTGRPVVGVVPYLPDLGLPEEDSVALEMAAPRRRSAPLAGVAVVRLPRIANFTDLAPLEAEPQVEVRYLEDPAALHPRDLLVLPGSKDTIADLRFLKARGFAAAVRAHAQRGGAVLGVCGGYQMLGTMVEDPDGIERGGSEPGLGLLRVRTRLHSSKVTRRVRARWLPHGPDFDGYEIRAGETALEPGARPLVEAARGVAGCAGDTGRVWGLSVHGLFDTVASRRHVLRWSGGGDVEGPGGEAREMRAAAYDRLADALEDGIGMDVLRRLLRR